MSTSGLENSWLNSASTGGGPHPTGGVTTLNGLDGDIVITGDRLGGNDILVTTNSNVAGNFINPVLVLNAGAGITLDKTIGGGQTTIVNSATGSVRSINATAVPGLTVTQTGSVATGFQTTISPAITTASGSGLGIGTAGTAPNQSLELNTANLVGGNGLVSTNDGTIKTIGLPLLTLRGATDRPIIAPNPPNTGVPSWTNYFVNDTAVAGNINIDAGLVLANLGQCLILNTQGTAGTNFSHTPILSDLPLGWYCYLKVVNHSATNGVSDNGPSAVFYASGSTLQNFTLVSGVFYIAMKMTNTGGSDYWVVY